jgi:hypothetical protein
LPSLLPDQTGMGAVPVNRAKVSLDLNLSTPAVSPTDTAADNTPQPGTLSGVGARFFISC